MIGNQETGYIVVPYGKTLFEELEARCERTRRVTSEWIRAFSQTEGSPGGS
jgi:hypothetical protein